LHRPLIGVGQDDPVQALCERIHRERL
jgi:hypothetical protein